MRPRAALRQPPRQAHAAGRGAAHLTGRQQAAHPRLNVLGGDVVAGGDGAALVQAAVQLHHNLARAVVVHKLKLADVACEWVAGAAE